VLLKKWIRKLEPKDDKEGDERQRRLDRLRELTSRADTTLTSQILSMFPSKMNNGTMIHCL